MSKLDLLLRAARAAGLGFVLEEIPGRRRIGRLKSIGERGDSAL